MTLRGRAIVACLLVVGTFPSIIDAWAPAAKAPTKPQTSYSSSALSSESSSSTIDEEEATFLKDCQKLCQQRNLKLENVKNARDLHSVRDSPIIAKRVYRMGRISDASDKDIELLHGQLQLNTLVDLRSPTELKDDPTLDREQVFGNYTSLVWNEKGKDGSLRELGKGESPVVQRNGSGKGSNSKRFWKNSLEPDGELDTSDDDEVEEDSDCSAAIPAYLRDTTSTRKERHFVSLMNEFKYVKGTVSKLRKRDITKAILKSPGAVFSKRVRTSVKKPFLDEINDGGLPMLNELLLRFGAPGIKYVLELVADRNRHPIAFYCTAGKDRTGMLAAIILALVGVEPEDIVQDYSLSANVYAEMNDHQAMVGALSQRNLDPKTFLGAPPQVMRDTLIAIEETYGSVEGYCDWIGFDKDKQEQLRRAVLDE